MLFTVTEFNKNLCDSKRLPYCFCFGVENVILVLFLGKKKSHAATNLMPMERCYFLIHDGLPI